VLTQILKRSRLPGDMAAPTDSTANVKANAMVRMDEHLTVFAVSATLCFYSVEQGWGMAA